MFYFWRITFLNGIYLQFFKKENIQASEDLKRENNDLKKKHDEAASKVLQLEEDIMTVTQKAIAKETELDRYLLFCSLPSLFYFFFP